MQALIRPRPVIFASKERRDSAHGGFVQSLAGMLPFLRSRDDAAAWHAFDVVVTSRNPLLASIVLNRAAGAGLSAAVVMSEDSDPWPYDLADTPEIATLAASAAGLSGEGHPGGGTATQWLLERLLSSLPRSIPLVEGGLAPASRHPKEEIALYMTGRTISSFERSSPLKLTSPEQARMSETFGRFMKGRPCACLSSKGKAVVFARQIVLTGRPQVFGGSVLSGGRLDWGHPRIAALGTARWDVPDYRDAARLMMEDILLAGRWRLPSAAPAS